MSTDNPGHEAVMSGHGFYNKHAVVQAEAAELGIAALGRAAASVPIPAAPQPLIVADYGCSHGQNSLRPVGEAVAGLRARTDLPVTVVHTDLPGNDFTALFESVAHDPASYVTVDGNAYALATGRSFYDEILPPASVALGWSATTTHWLSETPCPVPGALAPFRSDDAEILGRFARVAEADWKAFLAGRGAEIEPGGRLVMVEPCAHPDGHVGSEGMMDLMDEVLAELVADERVSAEVAAEVTLPVWMRTPAEYEAHITDHDDLEIVSSEVVQDFKSPLWAQFEADGDAPAYVEASIGSMRAWSEAMLGSVITDAAILDSYYECCAELGSADPERLHLEVFHVVLDLQRC